MPQLNRSQCIVGHTFCLAKRHAIGSWNFPLTSYSVSPRPSAYSGTIVFNFCDVSYDQYNRRYASLQIVTLRMVIHNVMILIPFKKYFQFHIKQQSINHVENYFLKHKIHIVRIAYCAMEQKNDCLSLFTRSDQFYLMLSTGKG